MKLICPASKWETSIVERGRYAGTKTKKRYVVGCDSWCMMLALETSSSVQGQSFYKGFCHLVPLGLRDYELDTKFLISNVIKALKLEKKIPIPKRFTKQFVANVGARIDEVAHTNFNLVDFDIDVFKSFKSVKES